MKVASLLMARAEELLELRSIMEPNVAELGFKHNQITFKFVNRLEVYIKDAELMIGKENRYGVINLNMKFHSAIYEISGNNKLVNILNNHHGSLLRYRIIVLYNTSNAAHAVEGHKQILNSFKKMDKKGVIKNLEEHFERARQVLVERLKELVA